MPTTDLGLSLDEARWLLTEDRPRDAIRLLESVVADLPGDSDARAMLAQAHLMAGDSRTAVRIARKAVSLTSTDEWPRRLLAFALLRDGQPGDAIVAARSALELAPDNSDSLKALFEGQIELRLLADARATAELLIEMLPSAGPPHADLARVLLLDRDYTGAESAARRALDVDPENGAARNVLATSLRAQGRSVDALVEFSRAATAGEANTFSRRQLVATLDRYVGVWALLVVIVAGWAALNLAPAFGLTGNAALAAAGVVVLAFSAAVIAIQRRRLRGIPVEVWNQYRAERRRTRVRRWGWVAYTILTLAAVVAMVAATFTVGSRLHSDVLNVAGVVMLFAALPVWRIGGPWIWHRYLEHRMR